MFLLGQRPTIARRVRLVFLLANTFTLALTFVGFLGLIAYFGWVSFRQELSSVSRVVASTSRAALAFGDKESGAKLLDSLREREDILYSALVDNSGRVLAEYGTPPLAKIYPPGTSSSQIYWQESQVVVTEPVILDMERLGSVIVVGALRDLYHQLYWLLLIACCVICVVAVLTGLLSMKLRAWVTEPLSALKELTNKISLTKDLSSHRLEEKTRPDEISEAFLAFNEMLSKLELKEQSLKEAKERAEEADRAKSLFVACVSHELRTPLHSIIGLTEEILGSQLNDENRGLLETVKSAGDALLTVINDILDFSKIEAGKLMLFPEPIQIVDFCSKLVSMLKFRFERSRITFTCTIDPKLPRVITIDPYRLQQILLNLLGNALKFTEPGGRVDLAVERYQNDDPRYHALKVRVSDSGVGIPTDQLENIFEAFTQVRKQGDVIQGTGLGLAITSRLVRMMHGWIWVESQVGLGSSFYFVAEYAEPDLQQLTFLAHGQELMKDQFEVSPSKTTIDRSHWPILVVEDNLVNQQLLKRFIEKQGYATIVASNGEEALEIYKTTNVQLVLMDVNMPVMDGIEATRRIRNFEREHNRFAPIIAVSASVHAEDEKACRTAGMNAFVGKPFKKEDLLEIIDEQLRRASRQKPPGPILDA